MTSAVTFAGVAVIRRPSQLLGGRKQEMTPARRVVNDAIMTLGGGVAGVERRRRSQAGHTLGQWDAV